MYINEGEPLLHFGTQYLVGFKTVHSTQMVGTQYATILLYWSQTWNFTFKKCIFFIKKYNKHYILIQFTLQFRALASHTLYFESSAFIRPYTEFGGLNICKDIKQTQQNSRLLDWLCLYMWLPFFLLL